VTGVAGPTGGSASKPVGMVCFAWAATGRATRAGTRRFPGDRAEVRLASAVAALEGLIETARD
jgi:nicotinamide mononucleotide (NMN) deamidase PncC